MSLFASLGQGDIWALSGISFASPINDLLDKGVFTLENLLEEDELIQEVKAKNELLVEFLSREETIDHLLDFVITPVNPEEGELRTFKYPYMSCEVICCEAPEILAGLVEKGNGKFLNKLFSFLSCDDKLDYYLAGYFEKILEMLFRRMTVPMMKYFNDAGTALLVKFLNHMDNYSIMQIVQRLMLPHIPFSNLNDNEADLSDEERLQRQCNWSYSAEACELLLNRMLEYQDADVPLHISDLLITVLQLSPPETLVITFLCEPACAQRLIRAVVGAGDNDENNGADVEGEGGVGQADIPSPGDSYSCAASVSLAAISVLESLNSRLFEASLPFEQSLMSQTMESQHQEHLFVVREQIDAICNELLPYIPRLEAILRQYLVNNPCKAFLNQSKTRGNRLGHRGLQLVKLVESIVRMSNPAVDDAFCQTGLFKTCISLFFHFENNSFLHLSVQRIIITILESDSSRSATQKYLLGECGLLGSIMGKISEYSTAPSPSVPKVASSSANLDAQGKKDSADNDKDEDSGNDVVDENAKVQVSLTSEGASSSSSSSSNSALVPLTMMPKHSSVMGHLVLIAQALSVGLDAEGGGADAQDRDSSKHGAAEGESVLDLSNAEEGVSGNAGKDSHIDEESDPLADASSGKDQLADKPGGLRTLLLEEEQKENGGTTTSLQAWDTFVQETLHSILDHQMVGSYTNLANLSTVSQDDPLKLGVDLDMFHMGGGGGGGGAGGGYQHHSDGGGGWHSRDHHHYGGNGDHDDDDDDDDDDDFMFHGPGSGGRGGNSNNNSNRSAHHDGNTDFPDNTADAAGGGFPVNFDAFSQRQNFTSSGFDLSTGEVVVASFADFASFDDDFRVGSASPDSFAQPVAFDDFANFAEFESTDGAVSGGSAEKGNSIDAKVGDDDFAPSEF